MSDYEKEVLIRILEETLVRERQENNYKDCVISDLKTEVENLKKQVESMEAQAAMPKAG